MKIVIVDYGMGNIKSLTSALRYIGVDEVVLSNDSEVLGCADKIILPGVGSFGNAMSAIKEKNIDKILDQIVVKQSRPLLGICLGMQLLGKSSTEDGMCEGLGFIDGFVEKFDNSFFRVPHVGFNQVHFNNKSKLYNGFEGLNADFYFTHSFRMMSNAKIEACFCNYGDDFVASFEFKNIAATQFHPELSQTNGLKLLKNFVDKF